MRMTATAKAERRATYRDVLDAPPHVVAEVLSGMLHTHPRPAPRLEGSRNGRSIPGGRDPVLARTVT